MPGDVVLSRELKSLQEELSLSQKARAEVATAASATPSSAEPSDETPDARELQDQLHELAGEVTSFFEDAEKSISAHPTQSVAGALLVGILIGRLLGRH